jgi:hypothetical protein
MHSHPKRLRAAFLVVAAVLVMAACGDRVQSASSLDDERGGTDSGLEQVGSTGTDPGRGELSDPGFALAATDRSIEPEPQITEGQPELGRPDEVVPEIRRQLDELDGAGDRRRGEVLEAVEALDHAPAAGQAIGIRDGRTRNEAGELNRLDETAALACGDVERALTALDDGNERRAADLLASAADRAARSTVDDIEAWATTLADAIDIDADTDTDTDTSESLAALVGFLSACTQGGYEL